MFSYRGRWLALMAGVCLSTSGWAQSATQKSLPRHVPAAVQRLTPVGRLSATQSLQLAIGLPLRHSGQLTNFLEQLYDPASTNYHRYLTASQFTERFGPTVEDYQAVIDFAAANGLEVAAAHGSRIVLDVRGKAADVEKAFHVRLQTYQHPTETRTFYAPDVAPSVDASLPILDIFGLSDYAVLRPALHMAGGAMTGTPPDGSGPNGDYMGYDFRKAYAPGVSLDGTGQIIGLFEEDGYYLADIQAYESQAGLPNVPLQNILVNSFSGNPGAKNNEVALDIEMAISMAPGLASVVVFEGPNKTADWVDTLEIMASQTQIKQFSSSWGYDDGADPNVLMDSVFEKMAAQGQSFFQASGDGDAYVNPIAVPSASPYVTSVGGTTLSMNASDGSYVSETVWNLGNLGTNDVWFANGNGYWGSGGGTSAVYSIPSWQAKVSMVNNKGSTTHRNIPDVALTADGIWQTYNNGASGSGGGTSAAAPLWAGFIALVNQQAAAHGNPPVGFINPAIYTIGTGKDYAECFHDITLGNNTSSASPGEYYAQSGFDLCTGWGTPAGQTLINALSPVDALGITPTTGWLTAGPIGGSFTNSSLTFWLSNTSASNLNWSCINTSLWLNVAPTNGTLAAGQAGQAVIFSLKATATNLPSGIYTANALFTNRSAGTVQNRQNTLLVTPGTTRSAYATALLALNPVAYWPLNETNLPPVAAMATNAGSLGFAGNGFPYNQVSQGSTGVVKNCYGFSNPGQIDRYLGSHVDVPYNPAFNPSGPFSVEFWAKPKQDATNYACPVSSIDETQNGGASRFGWIFYEAHTNQWTFRIGNASGYVGNISGGTVITNVWQHVAGVYDGTNVWLYQNGVLVAGPTVASGYSQNTNPAALFRIGATSGGNYTFDGSVDELAFYTNALSSNTVAAHYHAAATNNAGYGAQILAAQPVGYWHFDEPTNAVAAAATLPTAFNLGSLSYLCDGSYQPGCLPGVAGITNAGFGSANRACAFHDESYIDVPGTWLGFTGPITLVASIKSAPVPGQTQTIISQGALLYQLSLDGLGYPHFADGQQPFGDLVGINPLNDNQWHQLVGMYDGISAEYLYVDGQLVAQSQAATTVPAANGNDLWIGGDPDPGALQLFNGVIDEVAIFTNTLSSSQVLSLVSAGATSAALQAALDSSVSGGITLTIATVPGNTYMVEYCTNLTAANWNPLGAPATATAATLSITNDIDSDRQQFYRALQLP